jgi:beta-glucosidase/6-phospho-beta-glucosidase/beta-galactosidase
VGVNYYSPARATGMAAPITPRIPLFDFSPQTTFRGTGNPSGSPCPTTCTDFGWEIDPEGLRRVLRLAESYGKPLYVTENGIDDRDDTWAEGFDARFGLYSFDADTLARRARGPAPASTGGLRPPTRCPRHGGSSQEAPRLR